MARLASAITAAPRSRAAASCAAPTGDAKCRRTAAASAAANTAANADAAASADAAANANAVAAADGAADDATAAAIMRADAAFDAFTYNGSLESAMEWMDADADLTALFAFAEGDAEGEMEVDEGTRMCELCNTEQPRNQTEEVRRDHANQVMNGFGCCDKEACMARALEVRGRGARTSARRQ
jgi:hypothetical protein